MPRPTIDANTEIDEGLDDTVAEKFDHRAACRAEQRGGLEQAIEENENTMERFREPDLDRSTLKRFDKETEDLRQATQRRIQTGRH